MKSKNTLILFVIAVGFFAFIHFYESKLPTTKEAAERSRHVLNVDSGAINGITITNNGEKIELHKQAAGGWDLVAPVKDRADSMNVNQLLTSFDMLAVDDLFSADDKGADKNSLKDLGLENSTLRVKLSGTNAPPDILFGKDAAVPGKMYLRLDGSNTVYVVNGDLRAQLQKKADDFRDRRLLDFDTNRVDKMVIKSTSGEIDLAKTQGNWMIEKPLKARGDSQKIADLIAQTVNAHIETFEKGANTSTYGLSEPEGTISLTLEGGAQPATLEIGQPAEKDKEKVYARLNTRQSIYTLSKKIEDVLNVKPNDVRDKHLFKLNLDTVDRIHLEAAGKPAIVLARKQEEWTLKTSADATANIALVRKMVTDLQNQQATAFVTDVASDLPKYGLEKPLLKVTFGAYASENTAESKAGESTILTLDFGRVEGDTVYARLESEPYVVSVSKKILDSVPTDPAVWRDLAVFKFKPDDITSIEVVRDGQTTAVERAGNTWKLTKGNGTLNQTNIQSIQNALSALHAVRWTGSSTAGLGFEKPALVVSFVAGKQSGKLTLGSMTPENMWNAEVSGVDGAFILSKPEYDILHADIAQTSTPTPSATTTTPAAGTPASVSPAGVK